MTAVLVDKSVYLTVALLGKRIVDEALIGTLIVNVISNHAQHTPEIPIRVNDMELPPEAMSLRRPRNSVFRENTKDEQLAIMRKYVADAAATQGLKRQLILGKLDDIEIPVEKEMKIVGKKILREEEKHPVKEEVIESNVLQGMCYTYNVKLPLVVTQKAYPSFPFSISKATLKLEFSTISVEYRKPPASKASAAPTAQIVDDAVPVQPVAVPAAQVSIEMFNQLLAALAAQVPEEPVARVQLRSQILGNGEAGLKQLFVFGTENPEAQKRNCLQKLFCEGTEDNFDGTVKYDFMNRAPYVRIIEQKDRIIEEKDRMLDCGHGDDGNYKIFYPGFELEWWVTGYLVKNLLGTWIPLSVLLTLQWLNIFNVLSLGETQAYYTNAITLVLSIIVLLPSIISGRALNRHQLTVLDTVITFYFIGTEISVYPSERVALIGLNISTFSLILPLLQWFDYRRQSLHEKHNGCKSKDFEKAAFDRQGEDVWKCQLNIRDCESPAQYPAMVKFNHFFDHMFAICTKIMECCENVGKCFCCICRAACCNCSSCCKRKNGTPETERHTLLPNEP